MKSIKIISLLCLAILLFNFTQKTQTKPTLFIVGDSTVKNGSGKGDGGLWGWGDFIGQFLDTTKVAIQNHALGGTAASFQYKGLWEPVFKQLKKGDYVFIQFGHNDNGAINDTTRARGTIKGIGNETEEIDNLLTHKHEIVHTYGWYIRKLVQDAKSKGAIPVVFSPIPRNDWKDGKVLRNNESYGLWAKQIAQQEKVAFIDLNANMSNELDKIGQEKVMGTYFYERDHTHTSAKGAVLSATVIASELKKSSVALKKYLLEKPKIKLPKKKKVFLIGDSTMADNGNNENAVGWGVAFPKYVDTMRVEVINKARGGRSNRTYEFEGLWAAVREQLEPGSFVIIQFGHNDAGAVDKDKYRGSLKGNGTETQIINRADSIKETVRSFGSYIETYIKEAKQKGAIPIVMSQTVRNEWPNGKPELRDESYNLWSKTAAENQGADFIDLNVIIAKKYEELGKEKVSTFFPKDHTHTGPEGADFNALTAAESIKNLKKCALRDYIEIPKKKE